MLCAVHGKNMLKERDWRKRQGRADFIELGCSIDNQISPSAPVTQKNHHHLPITFFNPQITEKYHQFCFTCLHF